MHDLLLAALTGGLLSLDRTAFLQLMVSQPLVSGTLIGFLLGDPLAGLTAGSVLQLLWIGDVPVGGSIPPNETAAAVIATSISIICGREPALAGPASLQSPSVPLIVFAILLSIPLAVLCQRVDIYVRGYNRRFVLNADRMFEAGEYLNIGREHLKGLVSFFTASFVSILVLTGVGIWLTRIIYPLIPLFLMKGFLISFCMLVALGTAVSIRTARGKGELPFLAAGFLTGMVLVYLRG